MIVMSKALLLLTGLAGLYVAGTAALTSNRNTETAAYGNWPQAGKADRTTFQPSGAGAGSYTDVAPGSTPQYYYLYSQQIKPACPASACSLEAMFQFAR